MQEATIKKTFTLEKNLLQVMSDRNTYEYYYQYLKDMRLIPTTYVLLRDYDKYFKQYPKHEKIDFDVFSTHFMTEWHQVDMTSEDLEFYSNTVIPKLKDNPDEDYESILLGLMGKDALDKINSQEFDLDKIEEILADYKEKKSSIVSSVDEDLFTIDDVDFSIVNPADGLPWPVDCLNQHLGGLVQGQFVVVGAVSGAGKTAFSITIARKSFQYVHENHINRPILYFNSEGSLHALYGRFLSNLYRTKLPNGYWDVLKNQEKIRNHFKQHYNPELFKTYFLKGQDINFIKSKIEKYNPSLVIIDLLDAIKANSKEGEVKGLTSLYLSLRNLSSEYCPIIGTSQAGVVVDSRWPRENELYYSKSGKQGAADTQIMIGMDDKDSPTRYLSVVKDKVGKGTMRDSCNFVHKYSLYEEGE